MKPRLSPYNIFQHHFSPLMTVSYIPMADTTSIRDRIRMILTVWKNGWLKTRGVNALIKIVFSSEKVFNQSWKLALMSVHLR